jgi:hypothetical protein
MKTPTTEIFLTPEGIKTNPIGISTDTIQGSTQIAGERYP